MLKPVYIRELLCEVIDVVLRIERLAEYALKQFGWLESAAVLPYVLTVPLVDRAEISGSNAGVHIYGLFHFRKELST